jgi:hypothetical protein
MITAVVYPNTATKMIKEPIDLHIHIHIHIHITTNTIFISSFVGYNGTIEQICKKVVELTSPIRAQCITLLWSWFYVLLRSHIHLGWTNHIFIIHFGSTKNFRSNNNEWLSDTICNNIWLIPTTLLMIWVWDQDIDIDAWCIIWSERKVKTCHPTTTAHSLSLFLEYNIVRFWKCEGSRTNSYLEKTFILVDCISRARHTIKILYTPCLQHIRNICE